MGMISKALQRAYSEKKTSFDLLLDISEEYQELKSSILISEKTIKTLMISSSTRKEGTSTVGVDLAINLARDSNLKILLIDGNLRHPVLHDIFDLEKDNGLCELSLVSSSFRGSSQFSLSEIRVEAAIKKTPIPNLAVITSGKDYSDISQVFESKGLEVWIKMLKASFDYILFDSAPINLYPDSLFLAAQVDGVIFVVQAEKTRREVTKKAKERLEKVKANIIGVVLNKKRYHIPQAVYRRL
ncbi:MAG: CpsD/CapB family tyrosine-protein kinase [Deltaproteobacteria bacterium]|nr:CpsD/CapB family tyrosine-protein kinase [Deltaproteobacteria bacterium]